MLDVAEVSVVARPLFMRGVERSPSFAIKAEAYDAQAAQMAVVVVVM